MSTAIAATSASAVRSTGPQPPVKTDAAKPTTSPTATPVAKPALTTATISAAAVAALAASKEAAETPAQTAQEARGNDMQAQHLLAKEAAAAKASS